MHHEKRRSSVYSLCRILLDKPLGDSYLCELIWSNEFPALHNKRMFDSLIFFILFAVVLSWFGVCNGDDDLLCMGEGWVIGDGRVCV